LKGQIKKYLSYRGFGFIEVENRESDIFFHVLNFPKTSLPAAGQDVEFTLINTPKGDEATEIKLIEEIKEIYSAEDDEEEKPVSAPQKVVEEIDNLNELNGVGPKYQELLRAVGINSIQKLSAETSEALYNKLNAVNAEKEITKRPPTLVNVETWIKLAKE
jgi:cold shock CspA family protein